jgi:NAD(P)-dependent dehydrogenase (short-subunit alcohol dehydrogenase family)
MKETKAGGKLIVVTGCSRGCGRALTEYFVREGHTVAGCARSEKAIDELHGVIGNPHRFDVVDITDVLAVGRWAEDVLRSHGAPDLLVNNAAVIARNAPLWEVPANEIDSVLKVNVAGTINTIRGFVPAMIKAGRGVVVNFSSGWGRSTSPEVAIYCASKFAIEGLTQALSQELPRGLAAVALNPGIIDTEMLRGAFGSSAGNYPSPERWVKSAGPFILKLGPKDNGGSLDVPGVPTE